MKIIIDLTQDEFAKLKSELWDMTAPDESEFGRLMCKIRRAMEGGNDDLDSPA